MFSQASRKASDPQLTSVARAPRRHRGNTLPRPDRTRFRRVLASLTVVALVSCFGLAAAAPSSAAETAQNYLVVLKDGVSGSPELAAEISQWVRERLSAHEYPREVEFVDSMPLTTTGKVIRRIFRDRAKREATAVTAV